jgi:hypothetical protein
MNKVLKSPSAHQLAMWLEAQEYEKALAHCEPFVKGKIKAYLKNFPAHYQHQQDFFQEIYLHLLTKTFPSKSFREVCDDEHKFKHYFTRTIFNQLNTLLQRERNQQRGSIEWERAIAPFENDSEASDRANWLEDKAQNNTQEAKQFLACFQQRFRQFLQQFQLLFPKIAPKLCFMLKLTARAKVHLEDLKACFQTICVTDAQEILYQLSIKNNYQEADDLTVFELVRPYFERYREESATAQSMQRWLNQQISGDRGKKGILDYMIIQDGVHTWQIEDKRIFTDFLHYHFQQEEILAQTELATQKATDKKKSFWQKIFSHSTEVEVATAQS